MTSPQTNHLKIIKRLLSALMLLVFIQPLAFADNICFKEKESSDIVVQLENYDKQVEIIALLKEENSELERKIENLLKIQKIQEEQLVVAESTVNALRGEIDLQKESYKKLIKEIKPSFLDKIGWAAGGAGIGAILTLIFLI